MFRVFASLCLVVAVGAASAAQVDKQPPKPAQHVNGSIVRVDTEQNTVVIRVGDGINAKDMEFKVGKTTRFWGSDRQLVDNGLYNVGIKQGGLVWFQQGQGQASSTITELRLYNPNAAPPKDGGK